MKSIKEHDNFLSELKQTLSNCIAELDSIHSLFCVNPDTDFTRDRKISFSDVCHFMIELQSKSLPNEVMDYFGHTLNAPTASAFNQQRQKILKEGFEYLFHSFASDCQPFRNQLYHGYRLLACDGSDVNISRNPSDEETFIHKGEKGYNMIHLNALYDLLNHTYCDLTIQGKKKLHERQALNQMVDRYSDSIPAIVTADRGYESFNVFAHLIRKDMKFVIRMKDISSNGILSSYNLPDSEFDEYIETTLTRRHTRETLEHPDVYTILPQGTDFDYLDQENPCYWITFRIVRFQTDDGGYICVATNLPEEEFPLEEIRKIYKRRWGQETSFRELKYTIGLVDFHSRKKDSIIQEVYARMVLYNFCELVTNHAVAVTRENTKHDYKINFSTAVNICRHYLKNGGDEAEVINLIQRHLTAIRPERKYPMILRPKRNRDFMYRAA